VSPIKESDRKNEGFDNFEHALWRHRHHGIGFEHGMDASKATGEATTGKPLEKRAAFGKRSSARRGRIEWRTVSPRTRQYAEENCAAQGENAIIQTDDEKNDAIRMNQAYICHLPLWRHFSRRAMNALGRL
jgi:hypothetical protein